MTKEETPMKRTSKRLLIGMMLLCAVLMLQTLNGVAQAATEGTTPKGFQYQISGQTATITGYKGKATAITIPSEVQGVTVTGIGEVAFAECSSLTSITLPSGVTSIGFGAFSNCSSLKTITIPNSVSNIGVGTFAGCSNLKTIAIPFSVTSIGAIMFGNCTSLTAITIPASVTNIGAGAFAGCSNLKTITIPASVTSIGPLAFDGASVTIYGYPDSRAHRYATENDIPFVSLGDTAPDPNAGVTPKGFAYSISGQAATITGYEGEAKAITIPDRVRDVAVTRIGPGAFTGSGLTAVTIPNGVTSIGAEAFALCTNLTSINIPSGVTHIADLAFGGCISLTSITLPATVTSIGPGAFTGSGLKTITIPASVTNIGAMAFGNCSSLKTITIPKSVISIGREAFVETPVTIHGYLNSAAHSYAQENNIPFEMLDASAQQPGDANGDGNVDSHDLVGIIDFIILGQESQNMENADANGDGKVDIDDLVWIIDNILNPPKPA
jgi:hypothetical protein